MTKAVFPGTPILMIEPLDEMEPCLSRLAAEIPACHYVKAAAGREEGELIQTIWGDLAGSSFLPEPDVEKLKSGRQRRTKVTTLSVLLGGPYASFQLDLVTLDIQGFELEALSGAEATLGKPRFSSWKPGCSRARRRVSPSRGKRSLLCLTEDMNYTTSPNICAGRLTEH
jgi:FkbM family methyltransferase